jgi:hypothetical protein
MTTNQLKEITKQCFGDYAETLLDNWAVLPLNRTSDGKQDKIAPKGWNKGYDPDRNPEFHSLAIINGEGSGITAVDVDTPDLPAPVPPNVITGKGYHLYKTWDGEDRKIGVRDGVDLLGTGGYSIFYGKNKDFKHAGLYLASDLSSLLDITSSITGQNLEELRRTKEELTTPDLEAYTEMLRAAGYELDMEMIETRLMLTSKKVSEGNRNNRLFVVSKQAHQVGLDQTKIIEAFESAGLDRLEINDVVESAGLSVEYDTFTLYDEVQMWFDTQSGNVNEAAVPIMRVIADAAIVQHNLSPWIPQQTIVERLGKTISQQKVSVHLSGLESKHGVIQGVDLGRMADGRRKVKAYTLCYEGQPISDIRKQG